MLVGQRRTGPRRFYTRVAGADLGRGVVARARWDGTRFRTTESDVVLTAPLDVPAFRDPFVVGRDGGWSMVVGAGLDDGMARSCTTAPTTSRTGCTTACWPGSVTRVSGQWPSARSWSR